MSNNSSSHNHIRNYNTDGSGNSNSLATVIIVFISKILVAGRCRLLVLVCLLPHYHQEPPSPEPPQHYICAL